MTVRLTPGYLVAFLSLSALLGVGHEITHHVAGFALCGGWGHMSFNSFSLAPGCRQAHPETVWMVTLIAPLLCNYLPMWIGFFLMRRHDQASRLLGLTLVFAAIPVMRIGFSLLGMNDEPAVVRFLFGDSRIAFWLMNLTIWLLTVPPLLMAWRTLAPRLRALKFGFFLLALPVFVFVVVGLVLEGLLVQQQVLAGRIAGIPMMVLALLATAAAGLALTRSHLVRMLPTARAA